MRHFAIDLFCGFILLLIIWIITYNNHFLFGISTFLIYGFLLILYYLFTSSFNWIFTFLNFIGSFFLTGWMIYFAEKSFPALELYDEQYFPLADWLILTSIFWVVSKQILDLIFKLILKGRFQKRPLFDRMISKKNR